MSFVFDNWRLNKLLKLEGIYLQFSSINLALRPTLVSLKKLIESKLLENLLHIKNR